MGHPMETRWQDAAVTVGETPTPLAKTGLGWGTRSY